MIITPDSPVLITNGARIGDAAVAPVGNPVGNNPNVDHPQRRPTYDRLGSSVPFHGDLDSFKNILIATSNSNRPSNGTEFHSEFHVQYLHPPFFSIARPQRLRGSPSIN
ncbi:unnamed protein product [Cyclocybe aegerita]|uniref:Uncharacterized protein n=1 Tax=Cyclocybe aegerita TaxID=1973307 RepID=A0A8S0X9H7_CYCAE|nr:unnamed protein product [Cyclocybe aegerita]